MGLFSKYEKVIISYNDLNRDIGIVSKFGWEIVKLNQNENKIELRRQIKKNDISLESNLFSKNNVNSATQRSLYDDMIDYIYKRYKTNVTLEEIELYKAILFNSRNNESFGFTNIIEKRKDMPYYKNMQVNEDNTYELRLDNKIKKISYNKYKGQNSLRSIVFPETIEEIGLSAFEGCTSLERIKIPNSCKKIGVNAFKGCTSLLEVVLPDGIETIESGAFEGCTSLREINIPKSIKIVDTYTFRYCHNLEKISFSNGLLKCIRFNAFEECKSLKEVILPDGLEVIDFTAFENCSSLEIVRIPSSIQYISSDSFENCPNLKTYEIDGAKFLGNPEDKKIFFLSPIDSNIVDFNLHNDYKIINTDAFVECEKLESLIIDDGCTFVNGLDLDDCHNLHYTEYKNALYLGNDNNKFLFLVKLKDENAASCIIHECTQSVNIQAFSECGSLRNVIIPNQFDGMLELYFDDDIDLKYNEYLNGCYLGNADNPYLYLDKVKDEDVENFIIHKNTKIIGDFVFNCCFNIREIEIPNGVKYIGTNAFSRRIKRIKLPKTLIGMAAQDYIYDNSIEIDYCGSVEEWNEKIKYHFDDIIFDCY